MGAVVRPGCGTLVPAVLSSKLELLSTFLRWCTPLVLAFECASIPVFYSTVLALISGLLCQNYWVH